MKNQLQQLRELDGEFRTDLGTTLQRCCFERKSVIVH